MESPAGEVPGSPWSETAEGIDGQKAPSIPKTELEIAKRGGALKERMASTTAAAVGVTVQLWAAMWPAARDKQGILLPLGLAAVTDADPGVRSIGSINGINAVYFEIEIENATFRADAEEEWLKRQPVMSGLQRNFGSQ